MNWSLAYDNSAAVADSADFPARWLADADAFRQTQIEAGRARLNIEYGPNDRHRFDLFTPENARPLGLLVHVHGGYWMRTDKSLWSHFAAGALANGVAVAVPSYRLCPDVSIASITADVSRAIESAASLVDGPIVLSGHSAGGHLVSRQLCRNASLDPAVGQRVRAAASISGLHDLRPLTQTAMNDTLQLSIPAARAESPVLLEPRQDTRLYAYVGADELPELRRQTALLDLVWRGQLASTEAVEVVGKHHFDVIDLLLDPASDILTSLLKHC